MTEIIVKILLLSLITAPFLALWCDMMGKTQGMMNRVIIGDSILLVIAVGFSGFQERPHVAYVVFGAFCLWPIALLIAKAVKPSLSWSSMWLSVFLMSWFLVNLIIALSDGNPLGGLFGLLFGWIYMLIPFGILSLLLIGFQALMRRIRKTHHDQGPSVSP